LDPADLEGIAEQLYRDAKLDPSEPASPVRIAKTLLGADAVRIVPKHALRFAGAALVPVDGKYRIFVSNAVPQAEIAHHVGHELAHWALKREGFAGPKDEEEKLADYIGAALVAPRAAFLRAVRAFGDDFTDGDTRAQFAEAFAASESLTVLRLGETTSRAIALVRPGLVRVRGQLSFVWPDEHTLIGWARGPLPPGIVKARLGDDRARIIILPDEDVA
jgi:hypothetical protein